MTPQPCWLVSRPLCGAVPTQWATCTWAHATRRVCIFAARWVLRARSLLLGRARRQWGWELTFFWSVRIIRRHSLLVHNCLAPVVESRHFGMTQATFARAPLAGVEVMVAARVRPLLFEGSQALRPLITRHLWLDSPETSLAFGLWSPPRLLLFLVSGSGCAAAFFAF